MKRFIIRLFLFLLIPAILTVVTIAVVNRKINSGNYFSIDTNTSRIVFGHSHPECAFNDSLINDFKNFAQSGESYFYTYYKLKKIIENNSQVRVVFIEFTNNQLARYMDDWVWGDAFISSKYPKYSALMTSADRMLLFIHNPAAVLKSLSIAFKDNFHFLVNNKREYIKETNWGGFLHLERFKTDSILNSIARRTPNQGHRLVETSSVNIASLQKIIQLCKSKVIRVFLVRSPLHPKYTDIINETEYRKILTTKFSNVELLDFKDLPLNNNEYGDLEHLNYKGAKRFSIFFNQLIEDGLLTQVDKQAVINNGMKMFNKNLIKY